MVFGAIIKVIKTALEVVFRFLAWLLLTLGLWIPLLYVLLFVIVCALAGYPLGEVVAQFFIGLVISLVASTLFGFFSAGKKIRGKGRPPASKGSMDKLEKRQYRTRLVKRDVTDEVKDLPPKGGETPRPTAETRETRAAEEANSQKSAPKDVNIVETARREYGERQNADKSVHEDSAAPEASSAEQTPSLVIKQNYQPHEVPRIFKTRADPTVFIYEYGDRIDYYKRTRLGMLYMYSSYKQ